MLFNNLIKKPVLSSVLVVLVQIVTFGQTGKNLVSTKASANAFPIAQQGKAVSIYADPNDFEGVIRVINDFRSDVEKVCGNKPILTKSPAGKFLIIAGTIGKNGLIDSLIAAGKVSAASIRGNWENCIIQVVKNPFKGTEKALVIAGSDKRGTIFGLYTLSEQIGVSPWNWWADVPVPKESNLFVNRERWTLGSPAVKYRGIFLNDEAPALSGWVKDNFGGFKHGFYEKLFELILRLKGNYLWPAMWGNAFYDDDPKNAPLADMYGVVIGTSHHEPLMRAHAEWKRYGAGGSWNYDSNAAGLAKFWTEGIKRMGNNESIVTVGMRGDGDEPMSKNANLNLLEKIVNDQREIIKKVTGKDASAQPQLWALYKEVQEYYDQGMRVPDDVTLLLCDDNWGNIRKLPKLAEQPRKGGYGVYYHFDYVGGPRNYKWINNNNIARVWEQMNLAYQYNAREIWIVNVGDLKPMEFPISFFLDFAWNPAQWTPDQLRLYYTSWATKQFGLKHGKEIGNIIRLYSQYSARRKPELLDSKTYSIVNYNEFANVVAQFDELLAKAEKINARLPSAYRDAYFQLVLHPVKALGNLHHMYQDVAWNQYYAAKQDTRANAFAEEAKKFFKQDSLISKQYNKDLAGGKWKHFMDQVHIGYSSWNDPPKDKLPELKYVGTDIVAKGASIKKEETKSAENLIGIKGNVFFEKDGYVSIEAEHFTRAVNANGITWEVIPDIGKTGSGITVMPVTAATQQPSKDAPHTAYDFYVYESGKFSMQAYFSPTLNFQDHPGGLQYAIAVDEEEPQLISINDAKQEKSWADWVSNNIIIKKSSHQVLKPGKHTLKFWMVQPGVVLQKLVADFGGVKPSYLGPPETRKK